MELDLKQFVTFVAGVINATMEIESKAVRIQTIVKMAANLFNVEYLRWEEVRDELDAQADRDSVE